MLPVAFTAFTQQYFLEADRLYRVLKRAWYVNIIVNVLATGDPSIAGQETEILQFTLMNKVIVFVAIVAIAVSQVGCTEPELKPLSHDATVLAFGDSLTAGLGVSKDKAYPAVLQALTGRTVINAGVSGELTEDGLKRFPDLMDEYDPDLVILLEGGNDILQNLSLDATKANLSAMISLAKSQGSDVVLVGVPRKSLLSKTADLYSELAEQHQIPLEKGIISSLLKKPSMKSDSVHFNAAGYKELAETVYEVLRDSGAL